MAWYQIRTMKRQDGGPSTMVDSAMFEAADEEAAKSAAYKKTRRLPKGQFAVLYGPGNDQISSFEPSDA